MIPQIDDATLQAICDILGKTEGGLTGSEISGILKGLDIPDVSQGNTKRYRLFDALKSKQENDGCANYVIAFIERALNPITYTEAPDLFDSLRIGINKVLVFSGYKLCEDGKVRTTERVSTLSESEEKANRLKKS